MRTAEKLSIIDKLDANIIRALQTDARKPNVQIAKEINANETTVRRRIDQRAWLSKKECPPGRSLLG